MWVIRVESVFSYPNFYYCACNAEYIAAISVFGNNCTATYPGTQAQLLRIKSNLNSIKVSVVVPNLCEHIVAFRSRV